MSTIVETKYGKVQGVKTTSAVDIEYISFYGVPYAAPPLGELRFKDPIPPAEWTEVRDATQERLSCFATDSLLKKVIGTEDCLNVNIYTKNLQPKKPYPVMFYIYGGGFNSGSNSTKLYGPDFLLMADVIVVVCDFRLGPFGFTSFRDPTLNVPGNAGLKDQLMALKFVKDNIQNFGGDPNNITLFGHSSGAMAVHLHCISEQSRGLFHKAIILSGSVFSSKLNISQFKNWPLRLAKHLDYNGGDEDRDVLKYLQSVDPIRMAEEQTKIVLPEEREQIMFPFFPHVEPYGDNAFIPKTLLEMSRTAWGRDIDVLVGGTSDEGVCYLTAIGRNPAIMSELNLENEIPLEFNLVDKERRTEFGRRIRELYFGSNDPTEDKMGYCEVKKYLGGSELISEEVIDSFISRRKIVEDLQGDIMFKHNMTRLVESRQNSNGKGKTYFYRFAVDSPTMNEFRLARNRPNVRGVMHADELSYYFKHNFGPMPERSSMEFTAVQRFVSLMTSFATTGNPNDNVLNVDIQNVEWLPVDTKRQPFKLLNIGEDLEFKVQPEAERLMFWDRLYDETNTPRY